MLGCTADIQKGQPRALGHRAFLPVVPAVRGPGVSVEQTTSPWTWDTTHYSGGNSLSQGRDELEGCGTPGSRRWRASACWSWDFRAVSVSIAPLGTSDSSPIQWGECGILSSSSEMKSDTLSSKKC